VWQSIDNQTWTQVTLSGQIDFALFQNRFEIPIQPVQARYLKVTAGPLSVAVTTDPRYASILVTEIQFFEALSAAEAAARGTVTRLSGQLNGTGRLVLLKEPNLTYDASLLWTHANRPWRTTWSLANGLSLSRRLGRSCSPTPGGAGD
jgi:hypothetical protein